jgi:hypothetical protein
MNAKTAFNVPEWLNSLNELDIKSGGRPEVPDHILDQAREWLATILVDVGEGLVPHIRQLERYCDARRATPSHLTVSMKRQQLQLPTNHT